VSRKPKTAGATKRLPVPPAAAKIARGEIIAPGKLTRREWAKRLNDQWRQLQETTVAGFIQLGRDLIAAKRDLGIKYGNTAVFVEMVRNDLEFSHNSANAFIRIAKQADDRFVDNVHKLPPDWGTIDKLTRFDDSTFKQLLDDGTICPTLPRNDVASLLSKINRQKKHQRIAAGATAIIVPDEFGPFPLIYADPPWQWGHFGEEGQNEKGLGRTPDQHYPTLTYEQIRDFEIKGRAIRDIAHKDAALFLWCTSANILQAAGVMGAWGFEYSAHAVWAKDKTGMGLVFRNQHEVLLYGTRGNMPGPQFQPPSVFQYPRGKHSAKPPEIRAAIEKMFPNFNERTRLEIFARAKIAGWSVYGFEAQDRAAA
jgi:N6-adenosine-specific RNA methylase IME4